MVTVGSLFSGIGGLDLGFERAGFTVRWQCETDEFCRGALRKHWPDVPCYPDIRDLTAATVEPVDVLIGGFPCQDVSDAGLRTGIDGARSGLWTEYARLIRELRAHGLRAVAIENVTGLFARGMDRVLGDLAALGMDAEWEVIRAADVGAPHRRARVFIVAYAQPHTGSHEQQRIERGQASDRQITREASTRRLADASSLGRDGRSYDERIAETERNRIAADGDQGLAYAEYLRCCERCPSHDNDGSNAPRHDADRCDPAVADADCRRQRESNVERDAARFDSGLEYADRSRQGNACEGDERCERERGRDTATGSGESGLVDASSERSQRHQSESREGRVHGIDLRPAFGDAAFWPARPGEPQHAWEPPRCLESSMGRRADGLSRGLAGWRRASLQALGNAVVPQVAEVVAWRVRKAMEQC